MPNPFLLTIAAGAFFLAFTACAATAPVEGSAQESVAAASGGQQSPYRPLPASDALAAIYLCPITVLNAPPADKSGKTALPEFVGANGIALRLMPATNTCLSSGYGRRNGKLHRGIDYYSRAGGDALAAADGVVIEKVVRSDFGNMIVIDHGGGVFTRYAHLEKFASGVVQDSPIAGGAILGPIGATGTASVPHLHFEILTGAYALPAGSFGLSAIDPLALPSADGAPSAKTHE